MRIPGGVGGNPMIRPDHARWAEHLAAAAEWWLDAPTADKKNTSGVGAHFADYCWTDISIRERQARGVFKKIKYEIIANVCYQHVWNKYSCVVASPCPRLSEFNLTHTSRVNIGNMCEAAAFKMWIAGDSVALW